jgi:hypothetical protein
MQWVFRFAATLRRPGRPDPIQNAKFKIKKLEMRETRKIGTSEKITDFSP